MLDPAAEVGDRSSNQEFPTKKYYKLGNRDVNGTKHPCYGHLFETKTKEQVHIENAVILLMTNPRSWTIFRKGEAPVVKCQSFTGDKPAARVPSPLCQKTTAAEVGEYLRERAELYKIKALDDTVIKNIQDEECKGGHLNSCVYTHKGRSYPLCMHATPDGTKNCKPQLKLHCYNLDTDEHFEIDAPISNMRAGRKDSAPPPLYRFIHETKTQGHLYYKYSVGFGGASDEQGWMKLDIVNPTLIEDAELLEKLKTLREEEIEGVKARQDWVPEDESQDESVSEGEQSQGSPGSGSELGDDIPF